MHEQLLENNKKFQIIFQRLEQIVKYCDEFIDLESLAVKMHNHIEELKYTHITTIRKDCKTLADYGFLELKRNKLPSNEYASFFKVTSQPFAVDDYVIKYDIIGKLERQKTQQANASRTFEQSKLLKKAEIIKGSRVYNFEILADNLLETARLKRKENKKRHVGQYMGESSLAKF